MYFAYYNEKKFRLKYETKIPYIIIKTSYSFSINVIYNPKNNDDNI